jgi:glucose-6-phosphate 1-dehydrogenase
MSFDLVFFGGTGDLTWRKLMPALFQAFRHGKLPEGGRILAVARDERSDDEYRASSGALRRRSRAPSARATRSSRASPRRLHYRRMDLSQPEHYAGLVGSGSTSGQRRHRGAVPGHQPAPVHR